MSILKSAKIKFYFLAFFVSCASANASSKLETLRKPKTPCGLYLSKFNNGTGIKVADLETGSIDRFFEANPDLEATIAVVDSENLKPFEDFEELKKAVVRGKTKATQQSQYLFLVGVPWPKEQAQPLIDYVNQKVASLNLDFPPNIVALKKPSSKGLARIKEEMIYLLIPFSTDVAPATKAEIALGMQSVAISSGITIATQTAMLGPTIGLPASLMNMLFSVCTSIFRPFWGNYFSRHDYWTDKWFKQAWMTAAFTVGIYWAARAFTPEIADFFTGDGWKKMGIAILPPVFFQTLWRTPMENGLNTFIETESKRDNGEEARRVAASIRRWGTIFSTNCWLISVLYGKALFHAGIDWNIGHMGMILSAIVFGLMEQNPEWYQVGESSFRAQKFAPIKVKVGNALHSLRHRINGGTPPPSLPPDESPQ